MTHSSDRSRRDSSASSNKMHYSPNMLSCVNYAIEGRLLTTLEYESRDNDLTERTIEPLALIFKNRKRQLVGWCRLREDYRTFRLDRIELIKVGSEHFEHRPDFNVADFEREDVSYPNQEETDGQGTDDAEQTT